MSIVWRLPYVCVVFLFLSVAAVAGPFIISSMVAGFFLLGATVNFMVWVNFRLARSDKTELSKNSLLWCLRHLGASLFLLPAVFAPFSGWLLLLFGSGIDRSTMAPLLPFVMILWGILGLYYGMIGLVREWQWGIPLLQTIRNLPTAKAASAAVGLVELRGTARALKGYPKLILDFTRAVLVDKEFFVFEQKLYAFELEDESGRIRVDPSDVHFTVSFPLLALFTSFLGRCPFIAVLRRGIEYGWWPNRTFTLRDGDPIYVLGTLEIERNRETGKETAVVRPPKEARHREPIVASLLRPFNPRSRRSWQDVFILADADERIAEKLLARHVATRLLWGVFWTVGSIGLLTAV